MDLRSKLTGPATFRFLHTFITCKNLDNSPIAASEGGEGASSPPSEPGHDARQRLRSQLHDAPTEGTVGEERGMSTVAQDTVGEGLEYGRVVR